MPKRRAIGFLAAFVFSGCNCGKHDSGPLQSNQGVPATLAKLDFGNVPVGKTEQLKLPITNSGSGPLSINAQTISGPPFAEVSPFPGTLAPGAHGTATLAFTPSQAGPVSGTLLLTSDGTPSKVTVALIGNGLDLDLAVTPTALSFGQVPVGAAPAPSATVTFQNNNTQPIYLSFSTANTAPEYTVVDPYGLPVSTTPGQLGAGASEILTVTFEPDSVSIFNSSFTYTACEDAAQTTCLPPQLISLSGQGVAGALTFSPSPIAFYGVPSGGTAQATVTATNSGTAAVTVSCLYLQSLGASACGTASASFTLGAPSSALPATLQIGDTLTFQMTYTASGATTATDVLAATYIAQGLSAPSTATDDINASATAAPCEISIAPSTVIFNPVTVGNPVTQNVTLTNGGGSDCTVSGLAVNPASDPSYALAAGQATSLTISAGASAPIGVTFNLNNNGAPSTRLGKLDFQSNDTTHASVQVPLVATLSSPYAGGGAWPRWHHDNVQSGLSPSDTSWLTGTIAWTVNVGVPGNNIFGSGGTPNDYLNSPVVGTDGTIYQLGMDGNLNAINPDGGLQWKTMLEGPIQDPHPGTPIVANDGTIFVAFGDTTQGQQLGLNLPNGFFHVSSSGAILSAIPPEGQGDGFDLPPVLTNGGLLLGADDLAEAAFAYAINADGTFNLTNTAAFTPAYDQMSAVVGPDDTTYWCGGYNCIALSPPSSGFSLLPAWSSGITAFSQNISTNSDLALDVQFTGNLMIVLGGWGFGAGFLGELETDTSLPQNLVSVDPQTAQVVWADALPGPTSAQQEPNYLGLADATTGNSCPAIGADGTVYVGNFDGLYAVDGSTGSLKAGFPFLTSNDDVITAPAIGGDGTIFFGTAGGIFYAIHPDGTLRFKVPTNGRIAGSPAIGPDGSVYFTADDGNVYAVH